jgi:hypothetical protein
MEATNPHIDFCLVCEGIRPEVGGKATILGLFGMLPRVRIGISQWGQPLIIMFLLGTHGGKGKSLLQARVMNPDGTELIASEPTEMTPNADDSLNTNVGFGFMPISFLQEGNHEFHLSINGNEVYQQSFLVHRSSP